MEDDAGSEIPSAFDTEALWTALNLDSASLDNPRPELQPDCLIPLLQARSVGGGGRSNASAEGNGGGGGGEDEDGSCNVNGDGKGDGDRYPDPDNVANGKETKAKDSASAWEEAIAASIIAYDAEAVSQLPPLRHFADTTLHQLDEAADTLERLAETLHATEKSALDLRARADRCSQTAKTTDVALAHLSGFIDQMFLDPALIRHIVDGKVGEPQYATCLAALSTKSALYEMEDVRTCAAYREVKPVLDSLILTAIVRVRAFLFDGIALLKRPNTNVNIIKETVLLPHRALVEFVEQHAPRVFREMKNSYVETMSRTYYVLFRRYTAGLLTMKEMLPSESGDTLVGSLVHDRMSNSLWRKERPARVAGVSQFSLGERLSVLKDVEGPAIVLATAVDNGERFFYEQIHRSLGKMLSETCASEHVFCEHFFGEGGGRLFDVFFRRIVGILLEAVKAHTEPTRDTVGVLLALKVNEAQRSSMQRRNIRDLSDFFIQVDIVLKPKFKKLFDENIVSVATAGAAVGKLSQRSEGDAGPHIVTRRFAEFAASLLAIGRYGMPDDSMLEGMRRLRTEFNAFLNVFAGLFARPKLRYVFLVNNVDFVLTILRRHDVSSTEEFRFFSELQDLHMAAYVEHEVADHFPDVVSFVRQYERGVKAAAASAAGGSGGAVKVRSASDQRVKAVLRQFASNWRLGVQHMQDSVLREFPNYELGFELTRSLFKRLLAYHKRCEAAVEKQHPSLRNDVVTSTEIVYELRQRTNKV